MSYTAPSSNCTFLTPSKEGISRTDARSHVANALGITGYPTNLEVGYRQPLTMGKLMLVLFADAKVYRPRSVRATLHQDHSRKRLVNTSH